VNCTGVREALPEFALGVAPASSTRAIESHIDRCAACRKEAIDLQTAAATFAYAPAPVSGPHPELEERVVGAVNRLAGRGRRVPALRRRRAGVTLLAAAMIVVGLGVGAVVAGRVERQRLQAERTAIEQNEALRRFGAAVASARDADPGIQAFLGTLAPREGARGSGSALTIVSPAGEDRVIVVVSDLRDGSAPLTVRISDAKGHQLELGEIRQLDTGGGGTLLSELEGLDGYVDVTVRDHRGRVILRGTLAAETAVSSPSP
jgi:hypothetical protein